MGISAGKVKAIVPGWWMKGAGEEWRRGGTEGHRESHGEREMVEREPLTVDKEGRRRQREGVTEKRQRQAKAAHKLGRRRRLWRTGRQCRAAPRMWAKADTRKTGNKRPAAGAAFWFLFKFLF